MNPKIFGIEHILYIVISLLLTVAALVLIKIFCKTEKAKNIAYRVSAAVLLLVVILNNIFIYQWVHYVKLDSICGIVSLMFGVFGLICKKDSSCLHFVTYTALFTGLITTIYPSYIGQGSTIFFPSTITSLLHHSLSFYMAVLTLELGFITPNIKKWYAWPLGYFALITIGVYNIKFRGKADSMSINYPLLSGTNLNWFYVGLIFLALYTIFLIVYDSIKNKQKGFICQIYFSIENWFKRIISLFKKKQPQNENNEENNM